MAQVKPGAVVLTAVLLATLFGLLLFGLASMASAAEPVPAPTAADRSAHVTDSIAQRMQACVGCHGKEGRAGNTGYLPRIAGKPAGYLYNQLLNFRQQQRRNQAMNHLVQHMSDDYLREIAQYFADLDLPYPPAQAHGLSAQEQQLAQTLVFKGLPERQIPSCVSCHGAAMAGTQPAMPGLLTLPADYLIGQLGAWRTGLRSAKAPDCMAEVAKRLSPQEITVVARWLSAQTLPTGTKPAAAALQPLPLACGSGG